MAIDPRIPLQATVPDIFGAIQRGMEFADQRRTQPIVEELLKQREIQGRQKIAANRRLESQDEIDEAFRKAELGVGIARGIVENTEKDEDVPAALEQLLPSLQQLGFTDEDLRSVPLTRNGLKLFADALGDKLRKAGAPDSVGSPIISVTGDGEDRKYSVVQPVMDAGELVLQEQEFPGTPVTASLALTPEEKVGQAGATAGARAEATNKSDLKFAPQIKEATVLAEARAKGVAQAPQRVASANLILRDIDSVMEEAGFAVEGVNFGTAGFLGGVLSKIDGTPAADLNATLATIQANLGFDRLQAMRDASPTGGALGQVSERELDLLMSAVSSLRQGQRPEQLRRNLKKVIRHYTNWRNAVSRARDADIAIAEKGGIPLENVPTVEGGATRIRFDAQGNPL